METMAPSLGQGQ
jgi:hypothetical protein